MTVHNHLTIQLQETPPPALTPAIDYNEFATKVHCLIKAAKKYPNLLLAYLQDDTETLLKIALGTFEDSDKPQISVLADVLSTDGLTKEELPYLCYLIACFIEIKTLCETGHELLLKLQERQHQRYIIEDSNITEEIVEKVSKLCKLCLEFY